MPTTIANMLSRRKSLDEQISKLENAIRQIEKNYTVSIVNDHWERVEIFGLIQDGELYRDVKDVFLCGLKDLLSQKKSELDRITELYDKVNKLIESAEPSLKGQDSADKN